MNIDKILVRLNVKHNEWFGKKTYPPLAEFVKKAFTTRENEIIEMIDSMDKCFLCKDKMEDNKEHKIYHQALKDIKSKILNKQKV